MTLQKKALVRQNLTESHQNSTGRTGAVPCPVQPIPVLPGKKYFGYFGDSQNKAGLGGSPIFCRT